MSFTDEAWTRIAPIYEAIRTMPFNRELAAGTLREDRFRFYILQDARYLVTFSKVLAICAAKAPTADATRTFLAKATNALTVERSLHEGFFARYGIAATQAEAIEPSPTCLNYISYLLATAHNEPYGVGFAATLPCFWIYWEVGREIRANAVAPNPYQAWIDTYGDPAYGEAVREVLALADAVAEGASPHERAAMLAAFHRASQFEWMFWDSAYRLEAWPV